MKSINKIVIKSGVAIYSNYFNFFEFTRVFLGI